jgi:predicted porin
VTRVSPSGSSQTSFGLKGEENLGDGFKASFVLEGQLSHDTGSLSQDGRIFGRQSYVGLTTPFGEVRLGRQYAPIFYSTAFVTGERFGATDLFIEGGATNNLMVRQDNQISYWLKSGGFTGSVAYSPNAGSLNLISAARGGQVSGANGGILGAIGAGAESDAKVGRSIGFFGNYAFDSALNATLGYHRNDFDGAGYGLYDPSTSTTVASGWTFDKYQAYNLGVKYVFPSNGIMLDAAFAQGRYDMEGSEDNLKVQFIAAGIRVPVNQWTFSGQVSQIKFKNFTKGKDTGLMLGAEYALSKRTTLYARAVQIRDDEGTAADAGFVGGNVLVQGGPDVVATSLGLRETPVFAGAGLNPGGKSTYFGAGIRHTF